MSYLEYVHADPEPDELLPALAKANNFTLDELRANREGRISRDQSAKLWGKALQPLYVSAMTMGGWLLFLFVINAIVPDIVIWIASLIFGKSIGAFFMLISLGCAVSLLVGLAKTTGKTLGLVHDLRAGVVEKMEGRVFVSRDQTKAEGMGRLYGDKIGVHNYVINEQYFPVTGQALEALVSGQRYRVYCTPRSRLLLSIEPA